MNQETITSISETRAPTPSTFGNQRLLFGFLCAKLQSMELCNSLLFRHDIFLSFEESIFGAKRDIEVSCFETCDNCGGTGAKSRNCIKSCNQCGGRGAVMQTQETPFGVMSQVNLLSLNFLHFIQFDF